MGTKRFKVQMRVSVQLQRALNDTIRWINYQQKFFKSELTPLSQVHRGCKPLINTHTHTHTKCITSFGFKSFKINMISNWPNLLTNSHLWSYWAFNRLTFGLRHQVTPQYSNYTIHSFGWIRSLIFSDTFIWSQMQ